MTLTFWRFPELDHMGRWEKGRCRVCLDFSFLPSARTSAAANTCRPHCVRRGGEKEASRGDFPPDPYLLSAEGIVPRRRGEGAIKELWSGKGED